jgi:Winged helix DNA-binding domain
VKPAEFVRQRLLSQHLAGSLFDKPEEVVRWLGAVQAQDYAGAKWSVAQRTNGVRDSALDRAAAEGTILRTHILRPTWHFVVAADIRWMLTLTAPHVHARNGLYYRRFGLEASLVRKIQRVLRRALEGGAQLTRSELQEVLQRERLSRLEDDRLRLAYIMMSAELDGLVCSGARRGKQHTYALLEERVPPTPPLGRDQALAELARRYFAGHGPASLKDFRAWSGLPAGEATSGLEMTGPQLERTMVQGVTYWLSPTAADRTPPTPRAHLLPTYDEYTIAYRDHHAVLDPRHRQQVLTANGRVILIDGRVAGTWRRTPNKTTVAVSLSLFTPPTHVQRRAIETAARRYGEFLDRPVVLM